MKSGLERVAPRVGCAWAEWLAIPVFQEFVAARGVDYDHLVFARQQVVSASPRWATGPDYDDDAVSC